MIDWPLTILATVLFVALCIAMMWADSVMWRKHGISLAGVCSKQKIAQIEESAADSACDVPVNRSCEEQDCAEMGKCSRFCSRVRVRAFGAGPWA